MTTPEGLPEKYHIIWEMNESSNIITDYSKPLHDALSDLAAKCREVEGLKKQLEYDSICMAETDPKIARLQSRATELEAKVNARNLYREELEKIYQRLNITYPIGNGVSVIHKFEELTAEVAEAKLILLEAKKLTECAFTAQAGDWIAVEPTFTKIRNFIASPTGTSLLAKMERMDALTPILSGIKAEIQEAVGDVTEKNWNPEFNFKVTLTIAEARKLLECVK